MKTNTIFISRDVIFHENVFHFKNNSYSFLHNSTDTKPIVSPSLLASTIDGAPWSNSHNDSIGKKVFKPPSKRQDYYCFALQTNSSAKYPIYNFLSNARLSLSHSLYIN